MKNKKKQLGKLSFKKSTVAGLDSNTLVGGTYRTIYLCGNSIDIPCNTYNCGSLNCTAGCGTGTCNCPTDGCPPATQGCPPPYPTDACPSHSICPQGYQCY